MTEELFCPQCLKSFSSAKAPGKSSLNCPVCKVVPKENLGDGESRMFQEVILGTNDELQFVSMALRRYRQNKIALILGISLGLLVLLPSMLYAAKYLRDREISMELARQEENEFQSDLRELNYSIKLKTKISSNLLKKPASFWLKVLKQANQEQEVFSKFMLARLGGASRQEVLSLLDSNEIPHVLQGLEIIQYMKADSARGYLEEAIKLARHEDSEVKLAAVLALGEMNLKDRKYLPALFELGSNGTKELKKVLNTILVNLGPYEAVEIQPFLKHLQTGADPSFRLQTLLIFNQSNIDPSGYQENLALGLKSNDLENKRASATALAKILTIKPLQVLPILLPALVDRDEETFAIIRGGINLVQLNSTSNLDFLPALLTEKNDPRTRQQGLELISKIPYFKWEKYLPLIKGALSSMDLKLQRAALMATNTAGKEAVELSPVLKEIFTKAFNENKVLCLRALGKMGRDGDVVDEAIAGFVDNDKTISSLSKDILENLEPKLGAKDVPSIKKNILFGSKEKRLYLLKALGNSGTESSKLEQELISLLKDKDFETRIATLEVIGLTQSDSRDLLGEVLKCLNDASTVGQGADLVKAVFKSLEKIGIGALSIQDEILGLLEDKNVLISQGAFKVLGGLGKDALQSLPRMINSFKNRELLEVGSDQIAKLGSPAVKPLIAGLENKTPEIRLGCALALGKMGPVAKEAAPGLARAAFSDKIPLIRDAAKKAQNKVQAQPK
jgi:HEAT repeat protein